ncbi:MAG: FAD-dependent oxidoreductase, partial [Rhodospirillaceae bacterium]|nr:FAD-dependent oxidoreductase [Rhodospirillaceae bacterium]
MGRTPVPAFPGSIRGKGTTVAQHDALLKPLTIKGLTIRNRFLSTSHSPGYATAGQANDRYVRYHEEKARGGIGLTQFGGATATSIENTIDYGQLDGSTDAAIDSYARFAEAIHRHGAACMVQLRHGGRRERWDMANWLPAYAPSSRREPVHRSFPVAMDRHDIARVREDYAQAALRAKKGGLDGVEISCANQTLIDQFWSPDVNARTDDYGGSLENRLRFGLEILTRARELTGEDFVMGIRMSGDEMVASGLSQAECVEIAQRMAASGLVDFVSVMAAQGRDYRSNANSYIGMDAGPAPYLHLASAIKAEIDLPIFHATRITDLSTAARAVEDGHVDMVGMTRAFISDPHLARKLTEGREEDIRQCVGAAYCVDRVLQSRDTLCIQNASTSREADLPHDLPMAEARRKVVVVGAGPAGLEAARASAERGHDVVLFEREEGPGGQINLAAKVAWRESLTGITRWLDQQARKLGVDLRFGTEATVEAVRAEAPDVVVIATGGRPNLGEFAGRELAVSSWDILSGAVAPAEAVLLIDDHGGDQGPGCAEFMAERGSRVEIATPERQLLSELGIVNFTPYLRRLYAREVVISPDLRLASVEREGNKLVAVLRNEFSQAEEERLVDQVVAEHGTQPEDSLFQALRPHAVNDGETDLAALVHAEPQAAAHNPDGAFHLFRIGDAWTSR